MKTPSPKAVLQRGTSLIEVIIAMGVLAVAVPLVFGAITEAGKTGASAETETRSIWIIPACMEEIRASREGKAQYFTNTVAGQVFPPSGDAWVLAFSAEGKPVGRVTKGDYDKGAKSVNGTPVRYFAILSSVALPLANGSPAMMRAKITLEYPATAPTTRRQKLDFYTRIP